MARGTLCLVAVACSLPLLAGSVDLAAVEPGALVRIGKQLVGGGDSLELLLSLGIAGIEVGVVQLGKLAIGGTNVVLAGVAADTERDIGVFQRVHPELTQSRAT